MTKIKTKFVCQNCGAEFPKWQGQCAQCGDWNSLVEEVTQKTKKGQASDVSEATIGQFLKSFPEVESMSGSKTRFSTAVSELDRVLGGGLVEGAVVLIGGEPGIGKSTLLTQMVITLLGKLYFFINKLTPALNDF